MEQKQDQTHPVIIGLIHAKWCIHCRNLMPIWKQMKHNIARKSYQPPPLYMVIEQTNLDLLNKFNLENADYLNNQRVKTDKFPTIFKIRDGNIEYYNDTREPDMLEKWFMDKQYLPSYRDSSNTIIRSRTHPTKTGSILNTIIWPSLSRKSSYKTNLTTKKYRERKQSKAMRRRRRTIKNKQK